MYVVITLRLISKLRNCWVAKGLVRPFKIEFPEINPHCFGATGSNLKRELILLCSFNPIQTSGGF